MTNAGTDPQGCLGCDLLAGRRPLPGGVVHQTPNWVVNHAVGPLNVGTLVVAPREHVVAVSELDERAADELGPVLRTTAKVVDELCRPEQVYVCLWSHGESERKHLHFVVQPVTSDLVRSYGGLRSEQLQAMMFRTGTEPPAEQVAAFCAEVRAWFRSRRA
jgi:ATP adenylyltransferase